MGYKEDPENKHSYVRRGRQSKADATRKIEIGSKAYEAEKREKKFGIVKSFFNRVKSRNEKQRLDERKKKGKK